MSRMIRAELQSHSVAFFAKTGGMTPEQIRARLEQTGRTQTSLGRHLGKKKDSMSRLMNGARAITVDEAKRIEEFFADENPQGPKFRSVDVYGYSSSNGSERVAMSVDRVLDHLEGRFEINNIVIGGNMANNIFYTIDDFAEFDIDIVKAKKPYWWDRPDLTLSENKKTSLFLLSWDDLQLAWDGSSDDELAVELDTLPNVIVLDGGEDMKDEG